MICCDMRVAYDTVARSVASALDHEHHVLGTYIGSLVYVSLVYTSSHS